MVLYKPVSSKAGKGVVVLVPHGSEGTPTITDPATGKVYTGRFVNDLEGNRQFEFSTELRSLKNLKFEFGGESFTLESGGQAYEGSNVAGLQPRSKGSVGSPGNSEGVPPGFDPGNFNGQGSFPAYLGGEFPKPSFSKYDPIKAAPFNFTDPIKFGEAFGQFNRGEVTKNYNLSKDLSLDTLGTELKALEGYVPAAAALKRSQTSIDNQFNQAERTNQIDSTLPGARADLENQTARARDLASGRLPSSVEDRAYEVAGRSAAADRVSQGGFGAASSVARKTSDLMSAEQRLNLSKYGDPLLSSNITQKANLELAPTEYSDAGNQIKVNPTVSPAELISKNSQELNNRTIIDPNTGLQSQINQQEFVTGQEQQTRQFNASNTLMNNQFNTGIDNSFKMGKFGYDVQYAGIVSGAQQTAFNTQLMLDQQAQYQKIFEDSLKSAQNAGTIKSIVEGIGQIGAAIKGVTSLLGTKTDNSTGTSNQPNFDIGANDSNTTVGDNGNVNVGTDRTETPNIDIESPNPIPDFGTQYNPDYNFGDNATVSDPTTEGGRLSPSAQSRLGRAPRSAPVPPAALEFNSMLGTQGGSLTPATSAALRQGGKVLASAGISSTPGPGMVNVGSDTRGQPIYSDAKLAKSQDINAGAQFINSVNGIISPLGVLSKEDQSKLGSIGNVASNVSTIATLTNYAQRGDKKGFVNAVLAAYGRPAVDKLTSGITDPKTKTNAQDGLNLAASAYLLANQWGNMSGAQRSLGLASVGISAYKTATGQDLRSIPLVKDASLPGGQLSLGQGLGLFQAGYNTYALVKNWNDLSTVGKVALGTADAAQIAAVAKSFNLLGSGTAGSSVNPGASLLSGGNSPVVNALGDVAGVASIALGAQQVYKGWGTGGVQGRKAGLMGAAAIDAGLYALGYSNPYTFAAIVAVSVLGDSIKVGKSDAQGQRDGVRSALKTNGVVDKDYNVTLADGSKANVGIDGHGGYHDAKNQDMLVGKKRPLQAWDIDYTNDLDYASGMAGTSLSRLLTGGKATNIDQVGGQLGNAALQNVGYGKDFSKGNFDKVMANQRAMYSQAGIKSKADAYNLSIQMLKEGRVTNAEAIAMQQSFNMMYDQNGYSTAQKLMGGRMRGVEVAHDDANKPNPVVHGQAPTMTTTDGGKPNIPTGKPAGIESTSNKPKDFRTYNKQSAPTATPAKPFKIQDIKEPSFAQADAAAKAKALAERNNRKNPFMENSA